MRKFLLSLVLVAMAGFASAQTLKFERLNHDMQVEGEIQPGRFEVIGNISDFYELTFDMYVTNIGDENVTITCERIVTSPEAGSNYFCWGTCFSPQISQGDVTLEPGVPNIFNAHFAPVDENWTPIPYTGITIEYHFYERTGEHMVFEIYFEYNPDSVEENFSNVFSNAYPNPANNVVSFDYDMPFNAQTASVAIYNMMGQEVIRQDVNVDGSRLDINVSDLTDGVYFYSLIVNNQAVKTSKLVISK